MGTHIGDQTPTGEPVLPAFGKGCVTELLPAVLGEPVDSLPVVIGSGPRVLLILDGLGWLQLQRYSSLLPTLRGFAGGEITTVAPSTTATALTSITTSLTPGEHGIVGYRMMLDGEVFNSLRWGTADRPDCRRTIPPDMVQPFAPFRGRSVALVTKAEFRTSGFSKAHLRGGDLVGYRTAAVLVHEVARLVSEGEEVVYAYYDGIDKVAHEYGLRSEYEAELRFVDRLVADLLAALPAGTTLVVSADHGQLDCGTASETIHPDVLSRVDQLSGEARFRWLHAKEGQTDALLRAAEEYHGHHAWVRSRGQMLEENWFGPVVGEDVASRMGDVALLPTEPTGFNDPDDSGPFELIGRHGSLTPEEMLVPCIATQC